MKEKDENRCKTKQQIDLQIEQISRIKPRNHHQPIMQQLLMKSKLKHIQRQYLFNITRKIDENWNKKECRKSKNEQIREMTIESGRYEQSGGNTDLKSSLSYINNTDSKLIDNYKLKIYHTSTNKSNKNNCSSFLHKCRVATEHYDVLKNQIICKIKLKKHQKYLSQSGNLQNIQYHDKDKDKDKIQEQLAIRMGKQNDEELRRKERERRANRNRNRNRMNGRYWSQSNSDRHDQRYVNMSVAEFMEQKQQNISARMKQRFDQYRKQKILSQIQTEYQKPQLSRTLYPLITCRVQSRLNMMHN